MTEADLFGLKVTKPDNDIYREAEKRWDSLSKPIDGFGDFEHTISKIAAVQGNVHPSVKNRCAVIMCADNGIVEEGVSQSTKEVTFRVAVNLGNGTSSACTLAKASGTEIVAVDIGIDSDESIPGVLNEKVKKGSGNFLKGPALSVEEVLAAIGTGIKTADRLKKDGMDIIATGEMGIGNTTTSAVLLCTFLGLDPAVTTGRGAGLDDNRLAVKKEVVRRGVEILETQGAEDERGKALRCLTRIGGLDIAGLTGIFIGAALSHVPVIVDGMISAAAAVTAEMLVPGAKEYMIASHEGREASVLPALEYLGCTPLIRGNMALGEGTGAIMLFPLLDQMIFFYENASCFEEVNIEAYKRFPSGTGDESGKGTEESLKSGAC